MKTDRRARLFATGYTPHRVGVLVLIACSVFAGCGRFIADSRGNIAEYSTQPPEGTKISVEARHLNERGLKAFHKGDLAHAETLFRQSLAIDDDFGPAHNNLGQIYLARHELYLAAWEFEYAANLMPELAEPIVNIGLAYETAEQWGRAAEYYMRAFERFPTHPGTITSLARLRIKQDADVGEIAYLLDQVLLHDSRPQWVAWAKELKATRYRDAASQCGNCGDPACAECEVEASSGPSESVPLPNSSILDAPFYEDQTFEFEELPNVKSLPDLLLDGPEMEPLDAPTNSWEEPKASSMLPSSTWNTFQSPKTAPSPPENSRGVIRVVGFKKPAKSKK